MRHNDLHGPFPEGQASGSFSFAFGMEDFAREKLHHMTSWSLSDCWPLELDFSSPFSDYQSRLDVFMSCSDRVVSLESVATV